MERETSVAMPHRYGALMALVTRYHSNALVERRHVLGGVVRRNKKLTAIVIWVALSIIFVGICLYFFLLLPERTTTLVGSSAHWKAQCVVQVKKLGEDSHTSSRRQLKIWWTGTSDDVTGAQYQLIGLHSTEQASSFLGPFHPWVSGYTGSSEGLSDAERDYGYFLTITWKDGTETLHLQR